jgi:preprotein translocase subunit SecG
MLDFLETPLTVLHICVSFFLVLVVLLQPGKSGGLGAALGGAGAQQVFGGRGAGNFLSRLTWISAGIFFLTSVLLAYVSSSSDDSLADLKHKEPEVQQLPSPPKADKPADAPAAVVEGQPAENNGSQTEPAAAGSAVDAPQADEPKSAPLESAEPQAAEKPAAAKQGGGAQNNAPGAAGAVPRAPTAAVAKPAPALPQAAAVSEPAVPKAALPKQPTLPTQPKAPAEPSSATP